MFKRLLVTPDLKLLLLGLMLHYILVQYFCQNTASFGQEQNKQILRNRAEAKIWYLTKSVLFPWVNKNILDADKSVFNRETAFLA